MKFIIPQNYNFKNKLFGFINYSTLVFDSLWCILIFSFLHILIHDLNLKIFLFISLSFPIILLSIIGFYGDSFVDIILCIIKYILFPKLYLYKKY